MPMPSLQRYDFSKSSLSIVVDYSSGYTDNSVTDSLTLGTTTPVIDSSTVPVETSVPDSLSADTATPVIDSSSVLVETSVPDSLSADTATPVIDSSTVPVETSITDSLSADTATPVIDSSSVLVETSVPDSLSADTATPVIDSSTVPVETSITDTLSADTATPVIDSSTVPVETSETDSLSAGTATPVIDSSTAPMETLVTDSITASSVFHSSYSPTPSSVTDSSTSTTEPETTQRPPTTQPPQDISTSKPNLDTALFKLDMKVEVGVMFSPALNNNTSTDYEEWNHELILKLTPVYTRIPGFLYLAITDFTNGSVIGHYQVNIQANEPTDDVLGAFTGTFLSEMNSLTIFNTTAEPFTKTNNMSQILETIGDKCQATGICPIGFTCSGAKSGEVTCLSTCTGDTCQYGRCHIGSDGYRICKCDVSEDFVYSGDKCDIKTEKLSMEIGAIAGIAGGLGGGIILLLVVALVLTCCSRRKNKTKRHHSEDEIHLTGLEGDIWGRDVGEDNPAADTKEEYSYQGVLSEGKSYQSWLMQDKPEKSSKGQRRADDFRRTNDGNERQEWEQMEPAALFSHAQQNGSSGLRTGYYREDVYPDYDSEDGDQFVGQDKHKDNWNVGSDRPVTHLTRGQSKSRPVKDDYSQEGHQARSQPVKSKSRPVKDDYSQKGNRGGNQPIKSQQRPFKYDYGQDDFVDNQPMQRQPRLLSAGYKQGQSVYDSIETDEKYAIRRPTLH
ncbi:uncharacterized protein [Haliotis asinina]|uniref:uncharacterized protein n=1 Tax=Haliotis asinina TaxID=109174 RepID=UPI0035326D9F